jgi:2-polyprenyl-3-methyl-5-hydroxy-6-metoxy-1,4-benzoquinol methylase
VQSLSVSQIDYYETHADEYCRSTVALNMSSVYARFLDKLAPGAHIMDAGCGSGRDTKAFLQRGYVVTAFDGSPQMARIASAYTGQKCRVLRFQEIQFPETFDGVWACASLLHVPKCEMEDVLRRLVAALKPGGFMYICFIEGEGESISADGRLYNSYTADSLRALLQGTPTVREIMCWKSEDISSFTRRAPWLNFLLTKAVL